jgi:hypothetical protein
VLATPWFLYQAIRYGKYVGSLTQRMGVLPVSLNLDGDESIWIHAVSVGEALVARSLIPALREQYPGLKIFVSTTTMTGQQIARTRLQNVDAVFFFPFDLTPIVNHAQDRQTPALHHDGDRDLAEPAARLPLAGHQDDAGERTHLVAVVPALHVGALVLSRRARGCRPLLHAERRVGPAYCRHRRRSGTRDRDRQPQV